MPSRLLLLCLLLAACGEPAKVADRTDDPAANLSADTVTAEARPVRIGELGANFAACGAAGTTRNLKAGEALPVRIAPFDNAAEAGSVPSGARFFICTRSLDQKWFGIVADGSGTLAESCGVSEPVTRRRDYEGPCRSGWVQSAFVKVIAGEPAAAAAEGENESTSR